MRTGQKVAITTVVVISTGALAWSLFSEPKSDEETSTENTSPKSIKSVVKSESHCTDSAQEHEIDNGKPTKKEVVYSKDFLLASNTEQNSDDADEVASSKETLVTSSTTKDEAVNNNTKKVIQEPLVSNINIKNELQFLDPNEDVVLFIENKQQQQPINPHAAPYIPRTKKLSLEEILGSQKQTHHPTKKSRCTYWPKCSNKNCKFIHPQTSCRSGDDCRFGKKCIYVHPSDLK